VIANSSREAHAKQKTLAKERKAAKPNSDMIERTKKLWEKLRLKSHTEKEERNKLVAELFEIITGRVKDFVFKHDSVRVIQCAVKYSTMEQRRMIARELKGEFKQLAEGKYSKFLIAKLLEKGYVVRFLFSFQTNVVQRPRNPRADRLGILWTCSTHDQPPRGCLDIGRLI
jgi:pumilio family protein 6